MDKEVIFRTLAQAEAAVAALGQTARSIAAGTDDALHAQAIREFTVAYGHLWKLFSKIHIMRGVPRSRVRTAYECIAEAGATGWLKGRTVWETMIVDYGMVADAHDLADAHPVVARICERYAPEMLRTIGHLKAHYIFSSHFDRWSE